MPLWKSTQDALNRMCPISAAVRGDTINAAFSGSVHTWAPVHKGNKVSFCKGASLLNTGVAGQLAVHLTEDPIGTWYLIDLRAGAGVFGCEFDLVGDATVGSTVVFDTNLYVYPGMYSQVNNA